MAQVSVGRNHPFGAIGTPDAPRRTGFGSAGVLEVVEDHRGDTYRAVYTVKFPEAVFVLHSFQKKSKRGIATPKEDMDTINARLKIAEAPRNPAHTKPHPSQAYKRAA